MPEGRTGLLGWEQHTKAQTSCRCENRVRWIINVHEGQGPLPQPVIRQHERLSHRVDVGGTPTSWALPLPLGAPPPYEAPHPALALPGALGPQPVGSSGKCPMALWTPLRCFFSLRPDSHPVGITALAGQQGHGRRGHRRSVN